MKRYLRTNILGMSKGRAELGGWIEDHTLQVIIAIAQLYIFPYGNRVHWRKEVWDKFHEMKKFTFNKKLPDAEFILDNSWRVNNSDHDLETVINFVIDKESDYQPRQDISVKELYTLCESYFEWLASVLSHDVVVRSNEVRAKLDELGLGEELSI